MYHIGTAIIKVKKKNDHTDHKKNVKWKNKRKQCEIYIFNWILILSSESILSILSHII